jgi:hypothetical protein
MTVTHRVCHECGVGWKGEPECWICGEPREPSIILGVLKPVSPARNWIGFTPPGLAGTAPDDIEDWLGVLP